MPHVSMSRVRTHGSGYAGGFLVVVLASSGAEISRRLLGDINISLIYLVVVVWVATLWGLGPALLASATSVLVLDLFFLDSFGARAVANTDDWLTLLLFLLIAALTGRLAANARERAVEARKRERATAVLYDLSTALLGEAGLDAILADLTARVADTFSLTSCHIVLPSGDGLLQVAAGYGQWDVAGREGAQAVLQHVLQDGQVIALRETILPASSPQRHSGQMVVATALYLPLMAGAEGLGVMRVARTEGRAFTGDEEQMLTTFARQAALAIDKARLAERARRASALEEADRAKTAVLAAVSHDLRSPLAAIKTAVTGMLNFGADLEGPQQRELLRAIDGETDRLTHLVANLLDLSRIQGGSLHPQFDWIDVGESLMTVADRLGPRVPQRIMVDVPDDLLLVRADSVRLDQVLTNILENAALYAPPHTAIHLSAQREGTVVTIRVCDEGPGIPPSERERVFEPFYRGSGSAAVPGSGLGLAICRGIIEAHGGAIRAEAVGDAGACIVITLPGAVEPEHAEARHVEEAVP